VIGASLGAVALVTQLILLPRIRSVERVTFRALGSLLAVPRARLGLIVTVFAFLAQFTAYTYVAPYLQQLARVSPAVISLALLLFGVAGIGGNFVAGVALSRSVTVTLTTMKLLLAVSVILLPLLATSLPGVFVLLVVWGAVWGALPLGLQTWMLASSPSGPDSSLALFVTTAQLALAGGSVLGGIAVNTLGIAFDFFLAGGVAALGAVVLLILGLRTRPVEAGATG
jgi:predicted MFS family arabinose efflux permease